MTNKKMTIVLGAGASAEANLPVGAKLKHQISDLLRIEQNRFGEVPEEDIDVYNAIKGFHSKEIAGVNRRALLKASKSIVEGMPLAISIDNYLDVHNENKCVEIMGKIGIAKSILAAEQNSLLYPTDFIDRKSIDFDALSDTWYTKFFMLLSENCKFSELANRLKNLTLIIFNYDRCFEHFLYSAIKQYYGVEAQEAAEILTSLTIYHPYGVVGGLPWQDTDLAMDFGAKPTWQHLIELTNHIKTFTEGTSKKDSEIEELRSRLANSDLLLFLGFAFHPLNMQLLTTNGETPKKTLDVIGTAHGISDYDEPIVESSIKDLASNIQKYVTLRINLKCSGLMDEHWRSLAFS